jgi:hypothetical protein
MIDWADRVKHKKVLHKAKKESNILRTTYKQKEEGYVYWSYIA